MRIEVGYGLEGTLTDALSKVIITNAITPRFKAGDFSGGVTARRRRHHHRADHRCLGMGARPELRLDRAARHRAAGLAADRGFFAFVTLFVVSRGLPPARQQRAARHPASARAAAASAATRRRSAGAGAAAGGGFSGGGGSSGGGGASGGW